MRALEEDAPLLVASATHTSPSRGVRPKLPLIPPGALPVLCSLSRFARPPARSSPARPFIRQPVVKARKLYTHHGSNSQCAEAVRARALRRCVGAAETQRRAAASTPVRGGGKISQAYVLQLNEGGATGGAAAVSRTAAAAAVGHSDDLTQTDVPAPAASASALSIAPTDASPVPSSVAVAATAAVGACAWNNHGRFALSSSLC
jgi:hypothetical protein